MLCRAWAKFHWSRLPCLLGNMGDSVRPSGVLQAFSMHGMVSLTLHLTRFQPPSSFFWWMSFSWAFLTFHWLLSIFVQHTKPWEQMNCAGRETVIIAAVWQKRCHRQDPKQQTNELPPKHRHTLLLSLSLWQSLRAGCVVGCESR